MLRPPYEGGMTRAVATALLIAVLISSGGALAQDKGTVDPKPLPPLANPNDPKVGAKELFGRKVLPAAGATRVFGFYAHGCIASLIETRPKIGGGEKRAEKVIQFRPDIRQAPLLAQGSDLGIYVLNVLDLDDHHCIAGQQFQHLGASRGGEHDGHDYNSGTQTTKYSHVFSFRLR